MTRISTDVTRLLGIDLPIVQAGMSWVSSCAELPLAVSRAGGLGVIGAGPMRPTDLARVIDTVRDVTDAPYAVNLPLHRSRVDEVMEIILARRPPVLIASQGGPARYLARFADTGTVCLHVVASAEHACKAVAAGVDGLVVVGAEAGGHPPASMVSTLVLLRAIVKEVPGTPIIASGGFVDGAGLAAALALGAGAAQFGTRFIATHEASVHPAYQRAVLAASAEDTRVIGLGLGVIRALTNDFTTRMARLEQSAAELDHRRREFAGGSLKLAAHDGDIANGRVEAGQSAGLVDSVRPAGELVHEIAREYLEVVAQLPESADSPPRVAFRRSK